MPSARELSLILKLKDQASKNLKAFADAGSGAIAKFKTVSAAGFARVATTAGNLFKRLTSLKTLMVTGIAGIALRKVTQAFVGFEKAMNRVAALTGERVGPGFEAMQAQAKELGRTTEFSALQAAEAMAQFALSGFETQEIMAAVPKTLQLASAAQLDLASSADIVTNVLRGLQLPAEDLGRANDVLVKALSSTNVTLADIGQAFKFVGPVARSAGIEFEELTAAVGLLGNVGIQASMAGTALRGAMVKLLNPSKEAKAILDGIGVTVTDATGKMRPLADILEDLAPIADDTGKLFQIFGQRAGPGMAALLGQGAGRLRELTQTLRDSQGVAEEIQKVQLRGLTGELVRMRSAVQGAAISIGQQLVPFISAVSKLIRDLSSNIVMALDALNKSGAAMAAIQALGFDQTLSNMATSANALLRLFIFVAKAVLSVRAVVVGAKGAFVAFAKTVGLAAAMVIDAFTLLGTKIFRILKAVVLTLLNVPKQIALAFGAVINRVKNTILIIVRFVLTKLQEFLNSMGRMAANIPQFGREIQSQFAAMAVGVSQANTAINRGVSKSNMELSSLRDQSKESAAAVVQAWKDVGAPEKLIFDFKALKEGIGETADETSKKLLDIGNAIDALNKVKIEPLQIPTAAPKPGAMPRVALPPIPPPEISPEEVTKAKERATKLKEFLINIQEDLNGTRRMSALRALDDERLIGELRLQVAKDLGANLDQLERIRTLNQEKRNAMMRKNFQSTWQFISSSALRENKKMFEIFKAADIAQAIADTYAAANKALASAPPPWNYGLAAAVVAAGMANVAKIRSTEFGGGTGGGMGGGGGGMGGVGATPVVDIENQRQEIETQAQQKASVVVDLKDATIVDVDDFIRTKLGPSLKEILGDNVDLGIVITDSAGMQR